MKIDKKLLKKFEKGSAAIYRDTAGSITEILKHTGYTVCHDNTSRRYIWCYNEVLNHADSLDGIPAGMEIINSFDFFKKSKKKKKVIKLFKKIARKEIKKASEKAAKELFGAFDNKTEPFTVLTDPIDKITFGKSVDPEQHEPALEEAQEEKPKTVLVVGECYYYNSNYGEYKFRVESIDFKGGVKVTDCISGNEFDKINGFKTAKEWDHAVHTKSNRLGLKGFEDYLIQVKNYRGLKQGISCISLVAAEEETNKIGEGFFVSDGELWLHASDELKNIKVYDKISNTWAEPIEQPADKVVAFNKWFLIDDCGIYEVSYSYASHKLEKYISKEPRLIKL